jgi:AcrR family transcriptional regulator
VTGARAYEDAQVDADVSVREPVQRRSRERWTRVLDCGVSLIEEGGYEALTIAAVCERAAVPPRLIYERVSSKDALFLAVYEHGMQRVLADETALDDDDRWSRLDARSLVTAAVRELARVFLHNERFLRSVVLISSAHPEVRTRGAAYTDGLQRRFSDRVGTVCPEHVAVATVFRTLFASLVFRTAYGADFLQPTVTDDDLVSGLIGIALTHLRLEPV